MSKNTHIGDLAVNYNLPVFILQDILLLILSMECESLAYGLN